jgi:hypothetical protein
MQEPISVEALVEEAELEVTELEEPQAADISNTLII